MHNVSQKDNDGVDFLTKLAAKWVSSLDGVFINDLHEPSACVLEGSIQIHLDTNLALGGSDLPMCPDPDQVLGGSDLGASITTSLWWHSIRLTREQHYSPTTLRRFSHRKGLKRDESLDASRR